MNTENALETVALVQILIAIVNLFLVRILKWEADLARLPLLIYEVVQVHKWFISIIVAIFAVMTWRFRLEMASGNNLVAVWLAACIGCFWLFRTFLQVFYYSTSHWRGQTVRTLLHIACLVVYGGMSAVYLMVAWKGRL